MFRQFVVLFLLWTMCVHEFTSCTSIERRKRYLVYPKPGDMAPTKVQLILGLGLPMEVVDVSTIIGYVMKFNYVLPSNASYLTDSYVRYDRSIRNDVEAERTTDESPSDHQEQAHVITRWEIYEILESVINGSQSGKACLLKAICEASAAPFTDQRGLSSQLIHVLLTPSTTAEPFRNELDRVYHAAELIGRQAGTSCHTSFPDCSDSPLNYFTEVFEAPFAQH